MSSFEKLSVVTKNLSIVQKNLKAFAEERLFFDVGQGTATIINFNPDSDSGGQFVVQKISMYRLLKIFAEFRCNAEAEEMIDTLAETFLIDVDDTDFSVWAEFFLDEPCACYNGVIQFLREKIEGAEKMTISKKLTAKADEIVEKMKECHAQMSEARGGCAYVAMGADGEIYTGFEPTDNFRLPKNTEIARYKPYSWTDFEPRLNPETDEEWTAEEITEFEAYYRDDYDAREHLDRIIEECEQSERFQQEENLK